MWNGMCTIEMIENLKIENSTKIWVCAISPYHQRYVLPSDCEYPSVLLSPDEPYCVDVCDRFMLLCRLVGPPWSTDWSWDIKKKD